MCTEIAKPEYKYSEITGKILASAFEVHNTLGCGSVESVYHRSLEIEFNRENIQFKSEYELPVLYKNQKVGARSVDFLVEKFVTVEIKAVSKLENLHLTQAINYLEAFDIEIGLLINLAQPALNTRDWPIQNSLRKIIKPFKSDKSEVNGCY